MSQTQSPDFITSYFHALCGGTEYARALLPTVSHTAETVANRLLSGGDLYITAVRPDFPSEGYVRSGGLMLLKELATGAPLSEKDTVVFGWTGAGQDLDLARRLHSAGAHIVGIGPSHRDTPSVSAFTSAHLKSALPLPDLVLKRFGNADYPLVSLQNLILLWTFTAELVAACTRRKHMPAMYQSVLVPGARQRNARHRNNRFHSTHTVPSLEPGRLGNAYLDALLQMFQAQAAERPAIETSARACVETLHNNRRIHAFLISHFPVHQLGAPGDPGWMRPVERETGETPSAEKLAQHLQPGDLFFFLGYYRRPAKAFEIARHAGARIVEIITGTDEPEQSGPPPDFRIRPAWPYRDALVAVPGYDIPILPASGILQSAIYWSVIGSMDEQRTS